ncbi:MAG: deoxynucleoside kinase [Granulosicoccus sp.]|nr:deoxynucleoside kinase [Granulosicoccus sp.]
MKYQFIAIEGPIGVGKTTLATQLATHFKASFLTDTDSTNPYLKAFYRDPASAALHTQLHFLVSRLASLRNPAVVNPTQPIVADFLLDKDRLFAELTLDHTEWWMYSQIFEQQVANVPQPDLVIYLQAPLERLIERIERRGLGHEQRIDSNYLQQLGALYERFFLGYTRTPLLIVNAADINLADESAEVARLATIISEFEGGRQYFNPLKLNHQD